MKGSVRKRGKTWGILVPNGRHPDGRRRWITESGWDRYRDADRRRVELVRQLEEGTYVARTNATVGEYLTREWLPAVAAQVRPGTLANYQRDVAHHLVPALGGMRLRELTPGRVQRLHAHLLADGRVDGRGGLSPKTVRNVHTTLSKALADGVRWGVISRNVAAAVSPPRVPDSEMKVWSGEQLRAFLASVADDRLHAAWMLLATTGMRRGEVLGLRWIDADLEADRLAVRQTLTVVDRKLVFGEPKTRRGRRTVSLDARTVAALRAHRVRQNEERLAFGPRLDRHGPRVHPRRRQGLGSGSIQQMVRPASPCQRPSDYSAT